MNVVFPYIGVESVGLEYIAAAARKAGHRVSLLFDPAVFGGHLMWDVQLLAKHFDLRPRMLRRLLSEKTDVVAFSCVTTTLAWMLEFAREIKKAAPGIIIIFGGVHATAAPETLIGDPAVDCVCLNEGDLTLPLLLDDIQNGRVSAIPGVWRKVDGELIMGEGVLIAEDLDTLSFPAKDIYYDKMPILERCYTIVTSRGCPFRCTYCHNSVERMQLPEMRKVRRRSVDNVIEELLPVVARGNVQAVKFYDEVFPMNIEWMKEFAGKYREVIGKPYYCFSHPASLTDEMVECLAYSGAGYVAVGMQSVDPGQRSSRMNRHYDNELVMRNVAKLQKKGIKVFVDHILGIPGDTVEMMREAVGYYTEMRPTRLLSYWLTYLPGTEMLKTAVREGLVTAEQYAAIQAGTGEMFLGSGGGATREFRAIRVLMSLIPILPRRVVGFLLGKGFRFLPGSHVFVNIAYSINAVIHRDFFFMHNIRFILSRKKVP